VDYYYRRKKMGRPINSRFLGANGIDVTYHDGTGAVAGTIVKQTGSKTFLCTGGAADKECTLVWDGAADAAGEMSIAVSGGTFVKKIAGRVLVDGNGDRFTWDIDDVRGAAAIKDIGGAAGDESDDL
jgi:hypothetical protein